jgi:hypothetical protein
MNSNYIYIRNGFGNRIFDIIIGFYIKNVTKKDFCGILKSSHHKSDDIFNIFPLLKNKFCMIKKKKFKKMDLKRGIKRYNCTNKYKSIKDFSLKEDVLINKNYKCYKYVFKLYNKLPSSVQNYFKINENMIDLKVKSLVENNKYCAFHIRYGDKLKMSIDKESQFNFLIYNPKYYIRMINIFLKKGIKKIFILTDDSIIVNKFILEPFKNNKQVELLDINWINSFYVLKNCDFLVLSLSTFSMLAALFNKNLKEAYIIERPKKLISKKYIISPEEDIINETDWIKFNKRKYILNYDVKLMKKMLEYKLNNV